MDYYTLFHKIHCILRDGEIGLTGLSALNEINNMIFIMFNNNNLNDKYKFSTVYNNIVKKYEQEKQKKTKQDYLEEIIDVYCNTLESILKNEITKKYVFSDTSKMSSFHSINNKKIEDESVYFGACQQVMDMYIASKEFFFGKEELTDIKIKEAFTKIDYDILGDAYEKFKEEEVGNQGKKTGQYFTPRSIIKYCVNDLLKPKGDDLFYEPTCGTGGFIHFLTKYIHDNDKNNLDKFKNNIYGNDKTPELMKALYINLFLHNIPIEHIKNKNSLNVSNCTECFEKFDIIAGNPPYGVKNKIDPTEYLGLIKDNKDVNYFPKFMHSKKNELVKDSMGQFMIHVVNSLKIDGKFVLIIDRGIINNGTESESWQKELRKWLLNCCDIQLITLLPKGIFTSTMFDTAVIYGIKRISRENSCKNIKEPSTKSVKFYDGEFEDIKNKKGLIVKKLLKEVSIKDIIYKDWSLKYDDYVEKKEILQTGIEYKSFGEVCEFIKGKALKISDMKCGIYGVIGGGVNLMEETHDAFNCDENKILMSNDGSYAGYFNKFNKKLFITSHCNYLKLKKNIEMNENYLFYYLKLCQKKFITCEENGGFQKGQAQPSINIPKIYKEFKIPILPKSHQEEIVECIETIIKGDYKILDRLVSEFKDIDLFKFLIMKDYDTFKLALCYVERLIDYENNWKSIYEIQRKGAFKTVKGVEKTLGEVCIKIVSGNHIDKSKRNEGIIPYYGANGIIGTVSEHLFEGNNDIICAQDGTIGATHNVSGKYSASNHVWIIQQTNINKQYLYNVLKYYINYNDGNIISGQAIPKMTLSTLKKLIIPIPSSEDQEKVVKMIEEIEKKESDYNKSIETIKKIVETIYTNIEMKCSGLTNTEDVMDEDNTSKSSKSTSTSSKSVKTYKINGIKCIKEDDNYYEFINNEKGNLYAITNKEGEVELVEYITIGKKDYILIDTNVYTIMNNEPDELYGEYINGKFSKINNEKIIIDGKQKVKTIEELEAELGL
jgi:type I restriction-modification system DNA methylase subunit